MGKRDEDGRPVDTGEYMAELLGAGLAGMSYEDFVAERQRRAKEGK